MYYKSRDFEEPLMGGDEGLEDRGDTVRHLSRSTTQRLRSSLSTKNWWILHVACLVLYTLTFFALLQIKILKEAPLALPARRALQSELRHFPTQLEQQGNVFAGRPRDELHQAWHDLLANDNIHLPRGQIEKLGLHTVWTKDGSEGIASLSVHHSLHCLKMVREMMYKEYYYAEKSGTSMARQLKHADHCVEYIRESLMCKPDLSLVTFRWINDTAQHPDQPAEFWPTNFDTSLHECSKWEPLEEWASARRFDLFDLDLLDRPTS